MAALSLQTVPSMDVCAGNQREQIRSAPQHSRKRWSAQGKARLASVSDYASLRQRKPGSCARTNFGQNQDVTPLLIYLESTRLVF